MTQQGRKDDDGKLWAGTVLAGFRDASLVVQKAAAHFGLTDDAAARAIANAVKIALDASVTDRGQRMALAAAELGRYSCSGHVLADSPLSLAVQVGTYGARKYARDNWLSVEDGIDRYYEAMGRHVLDLANGERYDAIARGGSGLLNVAHVVWNIYACASMVNCGAIAVDFETNSVPKGAAEPPLPSLRLPLELGECYRRRNGLVAMVSFYDAEDNTFRVVDVVDNNTSWVYSDGRDYSSSRTEPDPWDLVEGPLS